MLNQSNLNLQQPVQSDIDRNQIAYSGQQSQMQQQNSGRSIIKQQNQQQPPQQPPLQPSVQINIHSLIKPMQSETQQPHNMAPIVYSFGQTDYTSKYLPVPSNMNNHSRTVTNKKITWGLGNNFEYEDDFADILG